MKKKKANKTEAARHVFGETRGYDAMVYLKETDTIGILIPLQWRISSVDDAPSIIDQKRKEVLTRKLH